MISYSFFGKKNPDPKHLCSKPRVNTPDEKFPPKSELTNKKQEWSGNI